MRILGVEATPIWVGYLLTVLWVTLLAIYITAGKGWVALWQLDFSNMGDFLAGAFAPLAFFWVMIAVLLQTAELRLQREELKQSRKALELQAAETRALVEQNKLSVEVATKGLEQHQQREREARLHQVIDALAFKITNLAGHSYVVVNGNKSQPFSDQRTLRKQAEDGGSRDEVFPFVLKSIVNWIFYVHGQQQPPAIVPSPTLIEEVQLLLTKFQELSAILASEPGLETIRMRVYALDVEAYVDALRDLLSVLGNDEQA